MRKHNEILETHVDEKITKALGESVKQEIDTLQEPELKTLVVQSLENMSDAADKLAANPKYQDLKTRLEDVTVGKKEVDKFQTAKIKYARTRLRQMGKLVPVEKAELEMALITARREVGLKRIEKAKAKDYVPNCGLCNRPKSENQVTDELGLTTKVVDCARCDREVAK